MSLPKSIDKRSTLPETFEAGHSLWSDARARLLKNRAAVIGGVLIVILGILSFGAPLIAPYDYAEQDLELGPTPPSQDHWMGTDNLGRDLFSRVLYGGRISLSVGILATAVSITIGVIYGTVSGYYGGRVDRVMMRLVDLIYAIPFTIFVILLMVLLGRQFILLFVAIGAVEWLTMARIVRAQVLHLKQQEFIEAAHSLGLSEMRIMFRHLIPNSLGPIIVYTTLTIPLVMLLESFLSFLGLGVPPPMSSWGVLIKEGQEVMENYPWMLLFPGSFFAITLMSFNFLGDGLRDALDTRASKD